jgi:hypothetical protein
MECTQNIWNDQSLGVDTIERRSVLDSGSHAVASILKDCFLSGAVHSSC